jgi:surface antigen
MLALRLGTLTRSLLISLTLAPGFVLLSATAADAATLRLEGSVHCRNGTDVVGIWIESSGGGSEWSETLKLSPSGSVGYFTSTISTSTPTNVKLQVGCGGTKKSWGSDLGTKPLKVSGSTRLNAICSGAQGLFGSAGSGQCVWPATSSGPSAPYSFPGGSCTTHAAAKWRSATGSYPGWRGNAHDWDDNARAAGWTVTSAPMARSVVVWEKGTTGGISYGSLGHVAWVSAVELRKDAVYLRVSEMNFSAPLGTATSRTVRHVSGMDYILVPNKSGVT